MPASSDPILRAKQLANLPNLRGERTATTWKPGDAPHLEHGAKSRRPQASPEWSPAMALCVLDLEERVDGALRDERGELLSWAVPSVEAVAIQRIASVRMDRWIADQEAKGKLKPEHLDMASKVGARYHAALDREALTLRSRLEVKGAAFDLATHWAADEDDTDVIDAEASDG